MACLRRDVRTGKLLIDPRRLDRVFDVVKTNVDNSASSDLYTGGKSCEVAATDYFSLWEEMQLQVEVSESLAQPAPARPHWQLLHILQVQSTGEDSDSDESGFWDLPLDWVQGSHSMQNNDLDYAGGCVPEECLLRLPAYYLSPDFLKQIASCSRRFLLHVCRHVTWTDVDLCIDTSEFLENLPLCKRMSRFWNSARSVTMTQAQVAYLRRSFEKILIRWEVERIPFAGPRSQGYMSTQTLLGCARFVISIPSEVRVLVLGVKSPLGARRIFMQIKELFTDRMCWSLGVSGRSDEQTPRPLPDDVVFPELYNEVMILWSPRSFALRINEQLFGPVQLRADIPDGPSSQSLPFVWATNPARCSARPNVQVVPLQTPILPSASCFCTICGEEHGVQMQEWAVCAECNTWVCKRHLEEFPSMQCPGCPSILADYVGGGTGGQALPAEILASLPSYFFSYTYLKNLAAVSKAGLIATSSREAWRNGVIDVDLDEFQSTVPLRCMETLWRFAKLVAFDISQLPRLVLLPQTAHVNFTLQSTEGKLPGGRGFRYFVSAKPLMGAASFEVTLPSHAVGAYLGVQDLDDQKRSFCRVDNLFTADLIWSVGVFGSRLLPHHRCSAHHFLPDYPNQVTMRWEQRHFSVELNRELVFRARLHEGAEDSASPLSKFFSGPFTEMDKSA